MANRTGGETGTNAAGLRAGLMAGLKAGLVAALAATAGTAQGQQLATQVVVSGLTRPVHATAPQGDNSRLFVVESRFRNLTSDPWSGRIRIVDLASNTVRPDAFFQLSAVATTTPNVFNGEQGLLGLAFHPQYLTNGYFYVYYTRASDFALIIARARANAPFATSTSTEVGSLTTILTIPHPTNTNHNGGWMDFGPDGNLYFAPGDGGSGNDPPGNAQNLGTLLGKMCRIDVDGADNIPGNADDADPTAGTAYRIPAGNPFSGVGQRREIWASGLRNPWRCAFDRLTGDLWIADVGQDVREEINVAPGNPAGRNYGWRCMEGTRCTGLSGCTCNNVALTMPILEYVHSTITPLPPTNLQGCSITGGYVYRGCDIPWLQGTYFFTDYCTPTVFSFRRGAGGAIASLTNRTTELDPPGAPTLVSIVSFAEDARGEMYIIDQSGGEIVKIVAARPTFGCGQCVADFDDGSGTGVPDGGVTIDDLLYYLGRYDAGVSAADVDDGTSTGTRDGGVSIDDLLYYLVRYEGGC